MSELDDDDRDTGDDVEHEQPVWQLELEDDDEEEYVRLLPRLECISLLRRLFLSRLLVRLYLDGNVDVFDLTGGFVVVLVGCFNDSLVDGVTDFSSGFVDEVEDFSNGFVGEAEGFSNDFDDGAVGFTNGLVDGDVCFVDTDGLLGEESDVFEDVDVDVVVFEDEENVDGRPHDVEGSRNKRSFTDFRIELSSTSEWVHVGNFYVRKSKEY